MKKFNQTKKALLLSLLVLMVCFGMFLGTTYAWFTDSVSSAGNIIQTGNLDVKLQYKSDWSNEWKEVDETTKVFNENALYEPGYTEVVFFRVSNVGSLDLKYNFLVKILEEQKSTNVNGEEFKISDYLQIGVYKLDEYSSGFNYADILMPIMFGSRESALSNVGELGKLSEKAGVLYSDCPVVVGENTSQVIVLVLTLPESVGNEVNSAKDAAVAQVKLGVTLLATQMNGEQDSFGSDYDKDATYPVYEQTDKKEDKEATVKTDFVTVKVPANAPAGNYGLKVSNRNVTTTADGYTQVAMDINLERNGSKVDEVDGIKYVVSINIGTGLNINSLTHNGEVIEEYRYSSLEGIIEFETSSFSPFAVTYKEVKGLNPDAKYLSSGKDIHSSSNKSGTYQLIDDVQTSKYGADSRYGYGYEYIVRAQADYTLDLNGKTVYHDTVNENANKNAFTYTFVANNAGTKLTINGEGKVISYNKEGYTCAVQGKDGTLITINGGEYEVTNGIAVWAGAGSHIIINDGSFVNSGATTSHELIYTSGGVIDIYGGFFYNKDGNYTLNVEDRNRATGFINVYGGTFVNFDPSTGSQDPNNIKVAEGYTVVTEVQENGDIWYIVVPVEKLQ